MSDFFQTFEHEQKMLDIQRAREKAEREARNAYYNALTPQALADELLQTLDIGEESDLEDLYNRLEKQAKTLDVTFYTSLHEAGLGHKAWLRKEPFYAGLIAQRQCRQTFDSLLTAQFCKQTEGHEKCKQKQPLALEDSSRQSGAGAEADGRPSGGKNRPNASGKPDRG